MSTRRGLDTSNDPYEQDEFIVEINIKRKSNTGNVDTVTHVVDKAKTKKQAINKAWNVVNAITKEADSDE